MMSIRSKLTLAVYLVKCRALFWLAIAVPAYEDVVLRELEADIAKFEALRMKRESIKRGWKL